MMCRTARVLGNSEARTRLTVAAFHHCAGVAGERAIEAEVYHLESLEAPPRAAGPA
jgi:hypothetical protein